MFEGLVDWASTAPPDDFWKTAIFLTLLTAGCFFGAYYFLIKKRIIQDTPTSKIRSAAQGYVELAGRCELIQGEDIRAPLTNTLCTWFHYTVEEYRNRGKNSGWVIIEQGTSDALFLLIDNTGQAVIDPDGADVTTETNETWHGHSRRPDTMLSGNTRKKWFHLTSRGYRYTEQRMHPGDPLYAIGLFTTTSNDNEKININNDVRDLLKEWKLDSESLLKQYDVNQNKKIDIKEWNKVRDAALAQVKTRHDEMKQLPLVNLMSQTHDSRRPYLLSALPEHRLVKKYGINAGLCIMVFFIAGILSTWLITIRLAG